jgi:hypothetical protein
MNLSTYQTDVWTWCRDTFRGIANWDDTKERGFRFLEEALELFQAVGMSKDDALKVVDYVYERPVGIAEQEVGGTMVTLLALCSHCGIKVERCLEDEFDRINIPEVRHKIREKQHLKNKRFF